VNLGQAADKLFEIRAEKRLIEKDLNILKAELAEQELVVTSMLGEAGITSAKGNKASVSITESIVPMVEDWDAFYAHLVMTGDMHLLDKRPSVVAYRELHEAGIEVPGIAPLQKRALSLRTI
jgi:hypothetical protein